MAQSAKRAGQKDKSLDASEAKLRNKQVDGELAALPEAETQELTTEPESQDPLAEAETTETETTTEDETTEDASALDLIAAAAEEEFPTDEEVFDHHAEYDKRLRAQYDATHELAQRGGDNPTGHGR